ncbi:hypothetical protein BD560DRAFT_162145 [Blakeslea trispora]|nr:hypothetical protein BD560DRAFT_162145 [Blakeslea trispora]
MFHNSQSFFLSIPLKQSKKLVWTSYLLDYIKTSYAEDPAQYEADANLLDMLRDHAINQPFDTRFAIEDLFIYLSQLTFLSSRFPSNVSLIDVYIYLRT